MADTVKIIDFQDGGIPESTDIWYVARSPYTSTDDRKIVDFVNQRLKTTDSVAFVSVTLSNNLTCVQGAFSGRVNINTSTSANTFNVKSLTAATSNSEDIIANFISTPGGAGTADNLFQVNQKNDGTDTATYCVVRLGDEFTNTGTPDKVVLRAKGVSFFNATGGALLIGQTATTGAFVFEVTGASKLDSLQLNSLTKNGFAAGQNVIQMQATGISGSPANLWINFRAGGSPTGSAGTIYSAQSNSHFFVHNDGIAYRIKFSSEATDSPDIASATIVASVSPLGSIIVGSAALATNATDGFIYASSSAGTPTGTPTTFTGRVPFTVDTTNRRAYFFVSSAWREIDLNTTSGTYTPTMVNVSNTVPASSTIDTHHFIRVGNEVTITGDIQVVLTGVVSTFDFRISLPVASNFSSSQNARGTGFSYSSVLSTNISPIFMSADTTNDQVLISAAGLTVATSNAIIVTYEIKYTVI